MDFKTLENISDTIILEAFNAAFSDYFIPLFFDWNSLQLKLYSESIDRNVSVGCFDGDKLVGFMLHGMNAVDGIKTVYNAGTGVLAEARAHNDKPLMVTNIDKTTAQVSRFLTAHGLEPFIGQYEMKMMLT